MEWNYKVDKSEWKSRSKPDNQSTFPYFISLVILIGLLNVFSMLRLSFWESWRLYSFICSQCPVAMWIVVYWSILIMFFFRLTTATAVQTCLLNELETCVCVIHTQPWDIGRDWKHTNFENKTKKKKQRKKSKYKNFKSIKFLFKHVAILLIHSLFLLQFLLLFTRWAQPHLPASRKSLFSFRQIFFKKKNQKKKLQFCCCCFWTDYDYVKRK